MNRQKEKVKKKRKEKEYRQKEKVKKKKTRERDKDKKTKKNGKLFTLAKLQPLDEMPCNLDGQDGQPLMKQIRNEIGEKLP